jgi:acyl carrier protein
MTRAEVLEHVAAKMSQMFEIDRASIGESVRLREDLDLDSIDAIDLAVELQELTGIRVEEAQLKKLRTVGDVCDLIHRLQSR